MKKLLFVLACAAGLGLWISCNNDAQDVNLNIDTAMVEKEYKNYGIVTATKVTMVTHKGVAVTYDEDGEPTNKPTDGKDWYRDEEYAYDKDGKIVSTEYWFYNDWDDGTEVTFDKADISWKGDISYRKTEYYEEDDDDGNYTIVGYEDVSNGKEYSLWLDYKDAEAALHRRYRLFATGNAVKLLDNNYEDYQSNNKEIDDHFSTASLALEGSLEGDFTIKGSLKALDYCYSEDKENRLDERYEPYYIGGSSDSGSDDESDNTSGGVEKPGDEEVGGDDVKPGDDEDDGQFGSGGDEDNDDEEDGDGDGDVSSGSGDGENNEEFGGENGGGNDGEESSYAMTMSGVARVSVAKLRKTSADTSVYYLKDLKFTKR